MDYRSDFVTIATAVWLAAYAAILLWYVALFSFGLSGEAVRSAATEVAILIGVGVAIDFLVTKQGRAE
jgi:hypothetical protein